MPQKAAHARQEWRKTANIGARACFENSGAEQRMIRSQIRHIRAITRFEQG
jgi:hypothetical protein